MQLESAAAGNQLSDLDALIAALEEQLAGIEAEIAELSEALLAGSGYDYLDRLSAESLTVSTP